MTLSIDPDIEVVLFDLGGVIVDLTGLEQFLQRHGLVADTFWPAWLELGAGNDFECGRTSPDQFAAAFLSQFDLGLTPGAFLDEFAAWPSGLLPGAAALVADVAAAGVVTATLSNTNPMHWNAELSRIEVIPLFARHFPSFELGIAKPDPAVFTEVVALLGVEPDHIAFLDDNLVNVRAAMSVGLRAAHVRGPAAARHALAAI